MHTLHIFCNLKFNQTVSVFAFYKNPQKTVDRIML